MHPDLITLYNLQLADTHIQIARRRLQVLDRGEAQQRALAALQEEEKTGAAATGSLEAALRKSETTLAETEARIRRSEGRIQRGEIHNEHELESMEKELVTLRHRRSELEDQALELMEQISQKSSEREARRAKEKALQQELEEVRRRAVEQKAKLEKEIADVTIRRETLAAKVSPLALRRYEQMRQHAGGVAVVRIVNGTCDCCHVAINTVTVREILETAELVPCQGCGRFLFTDSGTAPVGTAAASGAGPTG